MTHGTTAKPRRDPVAGSHCEEPYATSAAEDRGHVNVTRG